jgi:CelD/BcsL family acetyltransferase involved in cellulose biosynthesis
LWVKGEIFRKFADADGTARLALSREAQPLLFNRFDWFVRTMALCPPAPHPLIARARAEGSDGWLMLATDHRGAAHAMASWYTLRFAPIFTGNPDDRVKLALLTAIARRIARRTSSIRLPVITLDDAQLIARAFRRAGFMAIMAETTGNWTIDVTGQSFATYWAARPGDLRATVKRKGAKAAMAITISSQHDDAAWADYESIYAESWKGDEGAPEFLRAMAQDAATAGTLRLGIGRIDGTAVAAQLWTVEHGHAIIHKLAYREQARDFSPGSLLSAAMFEHVIDHDRVTLIDFGTGDDRYKRDWMDQRTALFTISLYNLRSARGLIGGAIAGARSLVARRVAQ